MANIIQTRKCCGTHPAILVENCRYTARCPVCGREETSSNIYNLVVKWNKAVEEGEEEW